MISNELEKLWKENDVVRKRRSSDDATTLNPNLLSPTMNVSVTPRNRANLRRLKRNSLQSYKRWEKENELLYAMIEDLADWLKKLFCDVVITPEFFFFALEDGSLLCRLANYIQEKAGVYAGDKDIVVPGTKFRFNTPLKKGTKQQKLFRSRENVQLFLTWCRSHSIPEAILFESNDVVEVDDCREGGREIVICLMELARRFNKYNLDEIPRLIQMEQEIEQEEREDINTHSKQGQLLDTHSAQQAEPEATSPTSVDSDSGVDSVFDEDNPANRLSEFSADGTDAGKTKTDKMATSRRNRELPSLLESTVPKSQLDEQVCKIAKDYDIKLVQRLKEGKYIILGRTMFVRMLNEHLLLRIGGGWDTLEHYLMTHVPKSGAETCTALSKSASPVTSRDTVKLRTRLFEQGKPNDSNSPPTESKLQEPPAVVISKPSPSESPGSPSKSKDKARKRLSVVEKDERDISAAIRKISSTVLNQTTPNITNKTFFLLKKRFETKGLFGRVRRRDSEPILTEAKLVRQKNMADFMECDAVDGLAGQAHPQEINANQINVEENGDVSSPELFVQTKVADASFSRDEIHTELTNAQMELIINENPSSTPLIDITTPGNEDGELGKSNLADTSEKKVSEGQELISFDDAPTDENPGAVVLASTEEDNLAYFEENNQPEVTLVINEFVDEENAAATELKSENEPGRNVMEAMKPESDADSSLEVKPVEELEEAPGAERVKDDDNKPEEFSEAKREIITEVKDDLSSKNGEVPDKETEDDSKKEKDNVKTKPVESAKAKPKAAVTGRPKSPKKIPSKLPGKLEVKRETAKPSAAAKKETSAKSSAAKAPGAVRKPEPKKAAERPKSAATRPTTGKKELSAAVKAPAGSKQKPARAAVAPQKPKPSAAVAPQKPAAARTTARPSSAAGPKKPATTKPGTSELVKPAASRMRPPGVKPASNASDKTDGQVIGKTARSQGTAAKPKPPPATKKPTTTGGIAKPKTTATGLPSKASDSKTAKDTKATAAKSVSGVKKATEGKSTARPGTGKSSSTTRSSAPEKPSAANAKLKVGAARPKSPVKASAPKGREIKAASSTGSKKPAVKKGKDTGGAVGKKTENTVLVKPSETSTEANPTLTEAVPNLESLSPPTTEDVVVRETKSETVEVEGDVVVRTVRTTREVTNPDGETQITTTTETVVEGKAEEVSLYENPDELRSDDQRIPTETVPNEESSPVSETSETVEINDGTMTTTVVTTQEVIAYDEKETVETVVEQVDAEKSEETPEKVVEGKAGEVSPESPEELSEGQRTPTETVPNEESPSVTETPEKPMEGKADKDSPESPEELSEGQRTPTETVPNEESPSVTETLEKPVERKADEDSPESPEELSEGQRTPTETVPNEESPPVTETPEHIVEGKANENSLEPVEIEISEDQRTPIEPDEESPPATETSEISDDGTMTTTQEVLVPDDDKETTQTVLEQVDAEKLEDVAETM